MVSEFQSLTAAAKRIRTPITKALWKWGQFDKAKPIFKILTFTWSGKMSTEEV